MKKTILLILICISMALTIESVFAKDGNNNQPSGQKQDDKKYGKDSTACVKNVSLYREFFKQWKASNFQNENFKDAIVPWRWVFVNCPRATENTYVDGTRIFSYLVENTQDTILKNKYIDTLMMIYDQRIKYFNKEGYTLGRKGIDMFLYQPANFEQSYNTLKRSVELEGVNSAGPVLFYYQRAAITMVKNSKADTTLITDVYYKVKGIIDQNLKKNKDNAKELANWEVVQGNLDVAIEPYTKCADLVSIFQKEYTAKPNDIDLLKRISDALDKKGCKSDPLYTEVSKKLQELAPAPK
jgi:hypothetical protein